MKKRIKPSNLKPSSGGLMGFTGYEVPITRMIILLLTVSKWSKTMTEMVNFLMMDLPSAYIGIINRPSQSFLGVILSVQHQIIKFPTKNGVWVCLQRSTNVKQPALSYYSKVKYEGKVRVLLANDLNASQGELIPRTPFPQMITPPPPPSI